MAREAFGVVRRTGVETRKPAERPSSGSRDPVRTQAAILAAATAEFAEKGMGGARVDAIADRAGTNKRMLYHYFGDKTGLYLAVLEQAYMGIRYAERDLDLAHRTPEDALAELARFTWRYFLDHPEFLSLLNTENLHKAQHLKGSQKVMEMHSHFVVELSDVLRRGAEAGTFRSGIDPLHVYLSIAALGYFYLSNRYTLSAIFNRELTDPRQLADWEAHIVQTVLASVRK